MSKHDLRARPIYHRKRDSIEAHLSVVFAALAVTRFIEDRAGWSIKNFVRTARRYRTVRSAPGTRSSPPQPATRELRDKPIAWASASPITSLRSSTEQTLHTKLSQLRFS